MSYIVFEDHKRDNFYPLTLNRITGDLRVGILKLRQRIAAYFETDRYSLIVPETLQKLYAERHPQKSVNHLPEGVSVFINSRLKIDNEWVKKINELPSGSLYTDGDTVIAAKCKVTPIGICADRLPVLFSGLKKIEVPPGSCWEYPWELIAENAAYINRDFEDFFQDADNHYEVEPGVTILNPYNVWIGEGTTIMPGVVIDASEGSVVLDEGCHIMPNSVIVGPAYIGKKSVIKVGAKIYEGTSIGPVCKIGGEVEATIFQAYTNKQHDGFLGHSYLGEWINIGANTNNSDLKNNYKEVSVYFHPLKIKIDSGMLFVGTLIGDHSKTAISSVINTGTVIGMGCNLIGKELFQEHIKSFSWGSFGEFHRYRLEPFVETVRAVKQRRQLTVSEAELDVFHKLSSFYISS